MRQGHTELVEWDDWKARLMEGDCGDGEETGEEQDERDGEEDSADAPVPSMSDGTKRDGPMLVLYMEEGVDGDDDPSDDDGLPIWDAPARRARMAMGMDDFPLGYPWHPDEECLADVEDALANAIDIDRALALLTPHRRELFQLLLGMDEVEESACPPPRTFAEVGRYLGWKYRGAAYSAKTMWRWYQESLALWRSMYGRPRPRPCQPGLSEERDTVVLRDACMLRKAA